jgi:Ca2+-binding EF-hand superfamily protein
MPVRSWLVMWAVLLCTAVWADEPKPVPKTRADKNTAAEKQRAEARKRAEEARKAQPAAVVAADPTKVVGMNYNVRKEVDRDDPIERILLLTPRAPLVVEVSMTIDGKPFRHPREKMVDEMLAAVDVNKDGKATWEEALKAPRYAFGQVQNFANEKQRQDYLKAFDKNGDGVMDRYEARLMIAQRSQGPDFVLYAMSPLGGGYTTFTPDGRVITATAGGDVKALLDIDNDGELSAKEIAAAASRLKSRDVDDDDVLQPAELQGDTRDGRVVSRRAPQTAQLAVPLGSLAEADAVFSAVKRVYGNKDGKLTADGFRGLPKLFEQLDKDGNDELDRDEVLALNMLPPHLRVKVALGSEAKLSAEPAIADLSAAADASGRGAAVTLPGVQISLTANPTAARTFDYTATGKSLVGRYDKNANGYIEKEEMEGNLAYQFDYWDANNDGKVYPEEIAAAYDRQWAPLMSQVRAAVSREVNSLFAALDANNDGRLSLREMRTATERLKSLDKNQDGCLTADEIPETLTVSFGLGTVGSFRGQPAQFAGATATVPSARTSGPEWFIRMDRNGDGDITPREFLGTPEQFKKLDSNGDGFVDPKEAEAAGK